MNKFRSSILISALSTIVFLLLAEGILRLYGRYESSTRVAERLNRIRYYVSENYFRHSPEKGVYRVPHRAIRQVAVYQNEIEFDVTWKSNNLGYADSVDYPLKDSLTDGEDLHGYAFIGDSFTQGVGATPWIPELRETVQKSLPSVFLYNLGMTSSSFYHFHKTLAVAEELIPISTAVVIAICNDLGRVNWKPYQNRRNFWFCPPSAAEQNNCEAVAPHFRIFPYNWSHEQIINYDRTLKHPTQMVYVEPPSPERIPQPGTLRAFGKKIMDSSALLSRMNAARHLALSTVSRVRNQGRSRNFDDVIDILSDMRSGYSEDSFYFLHLPEKTEVEQGSFNCSIDSHISSLNISYHSLLKHCSFATADYHQHDPHLNAAGYKKLQGCIQKILFPTSLP